MSSYNLDDAHIDYLVSAGLLYGVIADAPGEAQAAGVQLRDALSQSLLAIRHAKAGEAVRATHAYRFRSWPKTAIDKLIVAKAADCWVHQSREFEQFERHPACGIVKQISAATGVSRSYREDRKSLPPDALGLLLDRTGFGRTCSFRATNGETATVPRDRLPGWPISERDFASVKAALWPNGEPAPDAPTEPPEAPPPPADDSLRSRVRRIVADALAAPWRPRAVP
ncbi:MAG: hypothetical protein RQ833_12155 [Sphingomonadaceae bacterium]|nr:hypothetical protein [Sphingomonadaceae bacterium]